MASTLIQNPEEKKPGVYTFTFKEDKQQDGRPGRTVSFDDFAIRPCSYAELMDARQSDGVSITLDLWNAKVVDTDVEGINIGEHAHVTIKLQSSFTSRAIGLVKGGWLPSSLAAYQSNTVIFPDRNVVMAIVGRIGHGKKANSAPDFMDLFADAPIRINPALYALEGNARTIPDTGLVRDQLDEVVIKLQKALPKASLIVGPESLNGLLSFIRERRVEMERGEKFLLHLAPSLGAPVARKRFEACWNRALEAADNFHVRRNSLVVLAILSCIAVPNGRNPARRLLKCRNGYSNKDAYNALADLQALELLMYLFALFPNADPQICTADKDLSLFWVGIRASEFAYEAGEASFSLSPVSELLPGDALDLWSTAISKG